jgi:site-specific DNA recombinase
VRQVNLVLSLAFLAPQLVKAAVEGRLPRGINIERLRNSDPEWGRQFEELGLDPDYQAFGLWVLSGSGFMPTTI